MFYQWNKDLKELTQTELKDLDIDKKIVGYVSFEELKDASGLLNINEEVILNISQYKVSDQSPNQNILTEGEDFYFGIIGVPDSHNLFESQDVVAWYFTSKIFLCIAITDSDESTKNPFLESININSKVDINLGKFFSIYFRNLLNNYNKVFESYRKKLETLDDQIRDVGSDNSELEEEISDIHHELLGIYGYYEELSEVCLSLEENDNGIFSDREIPHFSSLSTRIERYARNINLLREYCTQMRASYQAQLDISLNKIMKIFTVVTTIFLPLNLIVGWYGMNFKYMPELNSPYGYPAVIIVSIVIVILCIRYFKDKNYW